MSKSRLIMFVALLIFVAFYRREATMFSCNYSNLDLSQTNFNCIAQVFQTQLNSFLLFFHFFIFMRAYALWVNDQSKLAKGSFIPSEIRKHFNRIPKLMTNFGMAHQCSSMFVFVVADDVFSNRKTRSSQQQFWHTWTESNQMRISYSINLATLFQFNQMKCATCQLREKMCIHIHDALSLK